VSVRLPERLPAAVGVNVTLIVQLPMAATGVVVLQVVPLAATAKSPVTAMLLKLKGAAPVLVTVTGLAPLVVPSGWLPKGRIVGDSETTGVVPVPVSETVWGLPGALSVSVRLPERLPAAVGVNVTFMTQLPLAATGVLVLQVVPLAATAKSPVTAMLVKLKGAAPVLFTVTVLGALVVPSGWFPKGRFVGDSETAGVVPVPVSETVWGLDVVLSDRVRAPLAAPAPDGANAKATWHVPEGAITVEVEQVVDASIRKPALTVILVNPRLAAPVLVMVTVKSELCVPTGVLPKLRLVVDRESVVMTPVPESVAVWVAPLPPPELSVMVRVADSAPFNEGVKVTLTVQLDSAAREVPQSFVWLKSLLLAPVIVIVAMVSGPAEFESVRVCEVLGTPTGWFGKLRPDGARAAAGGHTRKP